MLVQTENETRPWESLAEDGPRPIVSMTDARKACAKHPKPPEEKLHDLLNVAGERAAELEAFLEQGHTITELHGRDNANVEYLHRQNFERCLNWLSNAIMDIQKHMAGHPEFNDASTCPQGADSEETAHGPTSETAQARTNTP